MEKKAPVATPTTSAKPVTLASAKGQTGSAATESKERLAFRAALPDAKKFAESAAAELRVDLRDLLATDPDLAGLTKDELAKWVAEDVDAVLAEIAKRGWSES